MKYLLTLVSVLVVFSSSANATCPFQGSKQHASNVEQGQLLVSDIQGESHETEAMESEFLLLLKKRAQQVTYN